MTENKKCYNIAKCLLGPLSNTKHRPISVGLDGPVRPEISISSCIFLFSSPFSTSVWPHTTSFRECWLGPVTWQGPPPSQPSFYPWPEQVQISSSDMLVKPAGLQSYVSLPSTCIQELPFLVCTHDLLQWACLSLQDIGLQQGPRLCGEGHAGSQHQGSLSQVQQKDYSKDAFLHSSTPATITIQDLFKSMQQSALASFTVATLGI